MKKLLLIILSILYLTSQSHAQMSIVEAAEVFGIEPEISSVRISPDGDKLLMLQMYQGKKILVTKSLVNSEEKTNGIPLNDGEYVWADWANNDRIVAGITHDKYKKYSKAYILHDILISLEWTGKNQINLDHEKSRKRWSDLGRGNVLDWLKSEPDQILVTIMGDIFKLNILTNEYVSFHKTNLKEGAYQIDSKGSLRYIVGRQKRGGDNHTDLYRKSDQSAWQEVDKDKIRSETNSPKFEGITSNPSEIFFSKYDDNKVFSLYKYNVDSEKIIEKIKIDQAFSVQGFNISKNGELKSYNYFDGKNKIVYLTNVEKRVEKIIHSNFPNTNFKIESQSEDNEKFIINISSPIEPGSYYLLDLSTNKIEMIGYNYQNLEASFLSNTEIIEFISRDKIPIQGFLTLPKESDKKNLPTVILPHDGPNKRDIWGFDPLVQFLVSQGYATFQLNYRGSTGYGKKFIELANEEWANKILEDINDGTKWMIEQGYSDPDKICIYGNNYGGYAAIQTTIINDQLYKCSAAFSPITDIFAKYDKLAAGSVTTIINPDRSYTRKEFVNFRKKDKWSFRDVSPYYNIEKIKVPMFIMTNIQNGVYRNEQFSRFRRKMQESEKEFSYVNYITDDGEFKDIYIRANILFEVGQFLEKHLK